MKAGVQPSGNISLGSGAGQVRDIAAAKAGLGSGKTLEAAQKVIERASKLPILGRPQNGMGKRILEADFL